MEIRRIRPDEWRELRELRLAALADAPGAFVTTHAEASAYSDADWQEDAEDGTRDEAPCFVAPDGDRLVGMTVGFPSRERNDTAERLYVRCGFVRPARRR